MFLNRALSFAFDKLKVEPHTAECVASSLKYIQQAAFTLKFNQILVDRITRKHVRMIMDQCEKDRKLSTRNWNAYRTYFAMLFEVLYDYEMVEDNPVLSMKKRQEDEVIRETLTLAQRRKVIEHLTAVDPVFLRFIQIFFHSGARRSELITLRIENVYLDEAYFLVQVKKGRKKRIVPKVIKDVAMPFWKEQIGDVTSGYVFSENLIPGEKLIRPEVVTKTWKMHVKDTLGFKADLYSLKHLNTDEMSDKLSLEEAAKHNSHTVQMARKHYAINETLREMDRVRRLNNQL